MDRQLGRPEPPGADHLIKIDRAILTRYPANPAGLTTTFYAVPTRQTVLHRIVEGPDGNMWFTALKADKVGRVFTGRPKGPGCRVSGIQRTRCRSTVRTLARRYEIVPSRPVITRVYASLDGSQQRRALPGPGQGHVEELRRHSGAVPLVHSRARHDHVLELQTLGAVHGGTEQAQAAALTGLSASIASTA